MKLPFQIVLKQMLNQVQAVYKIYFIGVLLYFMCGTLNGQSVQHEAWKIKSLLQDINEVTIQVSDSCVEAKNCKWFINDMPIKNGSTKISTIGSFSITNKKSPDSNLRIIYKFDTLTLKVDSLIQVNNLPNKIAWTTTSTTKEFSSTTDVQLASVSGDTLKVFEGYLPSKPVNDLTDKYTISQSQHYIVSSPDSISISFGGQNIQQSIPENEKLHIIKSDNKIAFFLKMNFNAESIRKDNFYSLLSILTLHNSIRDTTDNVQDLVKTYDSYRTNPFLYKQLESVLYDYSLESELGAMDFNDTIFNDSIQKIKHLNYNWINQMYNLSGTNKMLDTEKKDEIYYLNLKPENSSSLKLLTHESEQANSNVSKEVGINQTAIIAGLSDFILARAKEELSITFLEKFRNNLNDNSYPEYKTLFPKTTAILVKFDISNYKNILDGARQSFYEDISSLGVNLPKLIQLPKYANKSFSSEIYNVALFFNLVNMVYDDKSIDEILVNTFQQLEIRENELKEFLNLEMAGKLSHSSEKARIDNMSSKLSTYTQNFKSIYNTILESQSSLYQEVKEMESDSLTTEELKLNINAALDSFLLIGKAANEFEFIFDNQKISAPDYIDNYTLNYINGKGYYGSYFKSGNYNLSDYKKYFDTELADSIYILKGLEQIDDISKANFDSKLNEWRKRLSSLADKVEETKLNLEYLRMKSLQEKLTLANNLNTVLLNGIKSSADSLQASGINKNTNVDLAALDYLYNILDDGEWEFVDQMGLSNQEVLVKIDQRLELLKSIDEQLQLKQDESTVYKHLLSQENYLDTFDLLLMKGTTVDSTLFNSIVESRNNLSELTPSIQSLNQTINSLVAYCESFEVKVDSNKVKSLKMTKKLLGITEFASHILHSVQFGFKSHRPVISIDTTAVLYDISGTDTSYTYSKNLIDTSRVGFIDNSTSWMTKGNYQKLFNDDDAKAIYLGLLFQQLNNLKYGSNISSGNISLFTTKVLNAILNIDEQKNQLELKKIDGADITFHDRYPFLNSIVELLSITVETPIISNSSLVNKDPEIKSFLDILTDGLSLYDNLSQKEYTSAVYNALSIFKVIADDNKLKKDKHKKPKTRKENVKIERLVNTLVTYGSFMAEVVKAETSDQVKAALHNVAAPSGSSQIKRDYMYNFSLNSYLGVAGGVEYRKGISDFDPATTLSLSVPIGFSFSKKFLNNNKGSWSLFAPILDIGAVTAFRFDDNDVSNLPDLNFQNFISPGLFLFRNFPDSPFTLGAGYQYGPTIRNIANGMTEQSSSYRWLISFTIDVPLLNFSTGKKVYEDKKN